MKFKIILYSSILIFFLSNCAGPTVDTSQCQKFKKASKKYIDCMNRLMSSTNTAKNMKEFKKHKTLKSFFKQVQVIESN